MKTGRPSFFILALLVTFPQLSETIYTPSLPEFVAYFSTTANMMQQSLSIYFFGFAIGVFLFGRACDVLGRRPSLLIGLLVYTFGTIACMMSPNILCFLAARCIQALGAASGSVVTQTMLRDLYSGTERAKIFSKIGSVIAFAPAMGPAIGSVLSYQFSPIANFCFLALFGLALLIVVQGKLQETRPSTTASQASIVVVGLQMIRDPHIWLCVFFVGCHNGILFSLHAEAPFILIDMLSMEPKYYGIVGLVLGSSVFLGSSLNAKLLSRFSSELLNSFACMMMTLATGLLVMTVPFAHLLSPLIMQCIFLATLALMIASIGVSLPNILSMSLKNYHAVLGTAGALFGLLYYLLICVLLSIMGMIHNGTIWPMPVYFFVLSFLMTIASGILFARARAHAVAS